MLTASCHCGLVRLEVDLPPSYLNECHCSICRRYGVRWGYHRPDAVRLLCDAADTQIYAWGERNLEFHRCRVCGCVTHWLCVTDDEPRMGVNARLFDPVDMAAVPVRRSDGPRA